MAKDCSLPNQRDIGCPKKRAFVPQKVPLVQKRTLYLQTAHQDKYLLRTFFMVRFFLLGHPIASQFVHLIAKHLTTKYRKKRTSKKKRNKKQLLLAFRSHSKSILKTIDDSPFSRHFPVFNHRGNGTATVVVLI